MNASEFQSKLKKDIDQVFLFYSALPVPANFAVHAWLVSADKENKITRWDVWDRKNVAKTAYGHVQRNIMNPTDGLIIWFWDKKLKWKSKFVGEVEGEIAEKMISFMNENCPNYKYKDFYLYIPGPNSNSFIQWIINHFPESEFKLPARALGKNYKGVNEGSDNK